MHDVLSKNAGPSLFGWMPTSTLAQAVELADRLGVAAVRLEGRTDEVVIALSSGARLYLLNRANDDPAS